MEHLYCPWRENYTISVAHTNDKNKNESDCIFCTIFKSDEDEKNLVLRRFKYNVVIFNRFPYNAGHLLILPKSHQACLLDLEKEARYELTDLIAYSVEILKSTLNCDGTNVGLNLGKAAGAGIPSHLHMHVLPRFTGDTNFLPTLGDTKAISFDLHQLYNQLKPEFDKLF